MVAAFDVVMMPAAVALKRADLLGRLRSLGVGVVVYGVVRHAQAQATNQAAAAQAIRYLLAAEEVAAVVTGTRDLTHLRHDARQVMEEEEQQEDD